MMQATMYNRYKSENSRECEVTQNKKRQRGLKALWYGFFCKSLCIQLLMEIMSNLSRNVVTLVKPTEAQNN